MDDTTVSPSDLEQIIRSHQANYLVFHAATEREVSQAIVKVLHLCPYVSLYYAVTPGGLERVATYAPETKKNVKEAPNTVEMSPAEVAQFFSGEPKIFGAQEAPLPAVFQNLFASLQTSRVAILPVVWDVEVQGVLLLGAGTNQAINPALIAPLTKLTEAIPIANSNVKAKNATKQRLREMEAISETSQVITSATELEQLYETLYTQISATMGADLHFTIALHEPANATIEIPFVVERGKRTRYETMPVGEGLISILLRTRQPLMLVEDTVRRAKALGGKQTGDPALSWLGCPLIVGGEPVGALVVQDTEKEGRFTQDDLRLLISLSAQVAGAIYNIRLLEDARRRALQLETVAEISREVSSSLIVDNLLLQAVTLVRERFNFYHAAVFLVEPKGEYATIREATGEAGLQMKRAGHKLAVGSKSVVGYVTQAKETLVVNDINKTPHYFANPLLPETKAEACLPLKVSERVLGVLDVQSNKPYAFNNETIKILQILADQLAVAVVNSELFAEAQERLSQHRLLHHVTTAAASSTSIDEALSSAVQGLQVTLGGDQIAILLADKEQKTLEVRSSIGYPNDESARLKVPFGVGVTGWVAAHRLAQRIGDVSKDSRYLSVNPKARSELAIPLIYRNEVLGVMNVESPRLSAYSENDEEMLGTLAGSLAAIIAHSRLLEQFRQQVERERLLYEITNKLRRTTNIEKILSITTTELSKAVNARRANVVIKVDSGSAGIPGEE